MPVLNVKRIFSQDTASEIVLQAREQSLLPGYREAPDESVLLLVPHAEGRPLHCPVS